MASRRKAELCFARLVDRLGLLGSAELLAYGSAVATGAIILRTIMETLGEGECMVSDLGLREGVLINLAMRIGNQ